MKNAFALATLLVAVLLLASCASSKRRPRSYGKRRGYHAPRCNCGNKRFIIAPEGDVYFNESVKQGLY